MKLKTNKTFVQLHQCEEAKKNKIVLEQYRELDGTFTWHHVKDSFQNSFEVNCCPYCNLLLPTEIFSYSQIEEISLLINSKQIKTEFDLDKTEVIQDILDSQNVIAFAEKAGENIQVRWDGRVSESELTNIFTALKKEYKKIKIGVYFKNPIKHKVSLFFANVNFLEMELEEFLLCVRSEKNIEKIS